MNDSLTDLIARWQTGTQDVFEEIYNQVYPTLEKYAQRHWGSQLGDEIYDMIQNAWTRAIQNPNRYDPDRGTYTGFMIDLLNRVVIDNYRKEKARGLDRTDTIEEFEYLPTRDYDPPAEYDREQVAADISHAFEGLNDDYRRVLEMDVNGFSHAEIGLVTGLTLSAVKTRACRARKFVREQLQSYNP